MSQGIYITGGEPGSGKSVVVLGIMEMTAWSSLRPTILRRTGLQEPRQETDEKLPAEVFELRDEKAYVIGSDKCGTCDCRETVNICPVQAISIVEG